MKMNTKIIAITIILTHIISSSDALNDHQRPSWSSIFTGWTRQLNRASGAKMKRELRDAGDNVGIVVMNRARDLGNAAASGVGKIYATVEVATETTANIGKSVISGTYNAVGVAVNATSSAYDAGIKSLADSSLVCTEPAWKELAVTIKHIFVHGTNDMNGNNLIKTISKNVMNNEFSGIASNTAKYFKYNGTSICEAWDKVPEQIRIVVNNLNVSHPHYKSSSDLTDAFEKAWNADINVRDHKFEDCNTHFDSC